MVGTAGGILAGVDLDIFNMFSWEVLKFSVSVIVCDKITGIVSRITTVYGSAYEEGKQGFISELYHLFLNWEGLPLLVESSI